MIRAFLIEGSRRMEKTAAVVLAAGSGKRMGTDTAKQFLLLCGKPVLYWTLKAFEESGADEVVLVVSDEEAERFCRSSILERYGIKKVRSICFGGAQRYDSVWRGLQCIKGWGERQADLVAIHDGARCLVTPLIIDRAFADAKSYGAAAAAMPVKDTIKIAGADGFAVETPDRRTLFLMQTPQTFSFPLIYDAYEAFARAKKMEENGGKYAAVTDDAEVLEWMAGRKSFLTGGSYENIKITTPEDLIIAEAILKSRGLVN